MIKIFEITRNGEPVVDDEAYEIAKKARAHIRDITGACFKAPTGRLRDSIRSYTSGNYVYITSEADYAKHQNDGVKSHVMWYLLGKTIPLKTERGVVYRKATIKSFLKGRWKHPGYPGKKFVEEGVRRASMEHAGVRARKVDGDI